MGMTHNHGLNAYGFAVFRAASRADRMPAPVSNDGRGFDSLRVTRRGFATPSHDGLSNGESRKRGVNAPASHMGEPCGRLSSLPYPSTRSVNPHGAAHPLTGVCGGFSKATRDTAMRDYSTNGLNEAVHTDILTSRDIEALFLRGVATPAKAVRVCHALEEITLQTLAALNAAAIGRTDALVSVKPEDAADIESVLVGLRYALALCTSPDDGEEGGE